MKKTFLKILIALSFVLTVFSVFTTGYFLNLKSGIADNVLRLHIVGATDSKEDQTLKLCVRDRILRDYSNVFAECETVGQTIECGEENLKRIEASAEDELSNHGSPQKVTASLEICDFPTKEYESIHLPAGKYTALNIKIGDAKGKNWWCVMYPPLCITDSIISTPESSQKKLKDTLSPEEYSLITEKKEIRFKIAEIIGKYIK